MEATRRTSVSVAARYQRRTVQSYNASAFLADLAAGSAFVALKLDIEGFEFTLLKHLLEHSPRALCALEILAVEWHEHMVPKFAGHTAPLLRSLQHEQCNVTTLRWH